MTRRNYLDLPGVRRGIRHPSGVAVGCLSRGFIRRASACSNFFTHVIRRRCSRLSKRIFASHVSGLHHRVVGNGLRGVSGKGIHYSCGAGWGVVRGGRRGPPGRVSNVSYSTVPGDAGT